MIVKIPRNQTQLQNDIDQITADYVLSHPQLVTIAIEKDAALKGKPREAIEHMLTFYPGIIAVAVHDKAYALNKEGAQNGEIAKIVMARQLSEAAHTRTGIDIHPGTKIGENLFIDHGTGTVVGETATIGNNTQIMHKVTLGAYSDPKETRPEILAHRHPQIGDDCFISVGVEVLGNVKIGNRVNIGPKALLFGNNITVGDGVTIGTGTEINDKCTIAPGINIKPGAFLHRGCGLIDRDIPAHTEVFRDDAGELRIIDATPEKLRKAKNSRSTGTRDEWTL